MKDLLEQIRQSAMEQLSRVDADLSEIRVKYLGKKGGCSSTAAKKIKSVPT